MEAMLSLKDQIDRDQAALIKKEDLTEVQLQRDLETKRREMIRTDVNVQTAFAGTGVCENNITFPRLAALIETNLTSMLRVMAFQASINSIQDQGSIGYSLRIASALAQMQGNVLL